MELIRKYFSRIKAQLVGLTISQKLLIALLGVVMLGTVFFTVIFSARPQMVPLIAQSMSAEEINRVEMVLKGKYDYQVSGDKVLVPAEQAYSIRGTLGGAGALPKDLSTAFSKVAQDTNPFVTESMKSRQWNNAIQEELARWLQGVPYLDAGNVIISMGQPGLLGRPAMPSTATVYVRVKSGAQLNSDQVVAIVDMVRGAVSGMKREDVHVIGDGQRAYSVPSSDTPMPADVLSAKTQHEEVLAKKLYRMFDEIENVKIAVNVVLDLSVRKREERTVDTKNVLVKPTMERTHENVASEGNGGQGQPGVQPNTGGIDVSEANGSAKANGSSSNETSTQNMVDFGHTTTETLFPPGVEMRELTASLSFPRSYFVAIFRRQAGDPKAEPKDDDTKYQQIISSELKKKHDLAKNTIGAKTDDQVKVDWFDDTISVHSPEIVAAAGSFNVSNVSSMIAKFGKPAFLGTVAFVVLGMMLMMVRRAVPAGADGEVDTGIFFGAMGGGGKKKKASNVEQLDAADDVFGEANQGEAVLTGIELDDETLQSRKMVDEVSTMIKENPENAAALVKRWMAKSK